MEDLTQEIKTIKERNRRVEQDKAWELSWLRRLFIFSATYIIAGILLMMLSDNLPWLKALVPAAGYILSTLTLPKVKQWWIKNNFK